MGMECTNALFLMITADKIVMIRLDIGGFVVVGFVYLRVTTQDRLMHLLAIYSKTCLKRNV